MKRKKWNWKLCQKQVVRQTTEAFVCVMIGLLGWFPAQADEWDLSEDGKNWMYYDYSGEPVKDEWIEDKGKTYYLDSSGNMKTGWVTNKDDGNQYFMGEDGAMVTNMFTPDNRFVGPDGVVVEAYDTYRKSAKAEIKKNAKKTRTTKKSKETVNKQQYFLLTDLNRDGYQDLVVMEQEVPETAADGQEAAITGGNLLKIAVWDPEEEVFQLSAEFDETEKGQHSSLYLDAQGQGVWLEIRKDEETFHLFQMEMDTSRFESRWNFYTQLDDWGGLEYYLDQDAVEKDFWYASMAEAKQQRGITPLAGYLPITDENMAEQIDKPLSEDELKMWQK